MVENALTMLKWYSVLLVVSAVVVSECQLRLIILEEDYNNDVWGGEPKLVPSTIERKAGTNLFLSCVVGGPGVFSDPGLVWGRRTKGLRFKNETDLERLAEEQTELLEEVHNNSWKYISRANKNFIPLELSHRGAYFCMSLKYKLFKVVHIKVKRDVSADYVDELFNQKLASTCPKDKFQCEASGYCISLHYKCDGKSDCHDDSDENLEACHGDPCEGKILCNDGRCIPTAWCCDSRTDEDCLVFIRPSCCPPLPDPYDPIHWYYNNKNQSDVKEMQKGNGSRYLFIAICVISAILSFVLFLFVISKICGFDSKPVRSRHTGSCRTRQNDSAAFPDFNRCGHSECAIRREFSPNVRCLYRTGVNTTQNSDSNEVGDPLIIISSINLRGSSPSEMSDLPPPYAEVVSLPPSIDKCSLDDLINAPPPPYSSTNIFSETEGRLGNSVSASDANAANNNQSTRCDIGTTGDSNGNV